MFLQPCLFFSSSLPILVCEHVELLSLFPTLQCLICSAFWDLLFFSVMYCLNTNPSSCDSPPTPANFYSCFMNQHIYPLPRVLIRNKFESGSLIYEVLPLIKFITLIGNHVIALKFRILCEDRGCVSISILKLFCKVFVRYYTTLEAFTFALSYHPVQCLAMSVD